MDIRIKLKKPNFDYHQLLLSWFSPSFPVGSFNFSHGLEAAIEYEFVYDKISLEEWIKHLIINGTGKTDSILLTNAYNGEEVNELALALCASKERWIETSNLGKAFCKNIRENWGYKIDKNLAYPIAIGKAGLYFKIPLEKLLIAFLQSFVSNLINVGIKHIPLGQSEGQKILINFLSVIAKQANIHKITKVSNLGSSAFLSDLSSMYHETLNNRIYQT